MNLDHRQTDALLAVIETGSFDAAAARLHVTQSAVSQRIRALETALGQPLIIRSRPARPTLHGQRLLQYLRRTAMLDQELAAELADTARAPLVVRLAINADTLGTWFMPAVTPLLLKENVLLEVMLDDQDHTFAWLESGEATGCVTSEAEPMRGCQSYALGVQRYHMLASPAFYQRWFANGFTREAARHAPVMVFNRKDALQADFLEQRFGLTRDAYPSHYIPSHDSYFAAVKLGLGYGMIPEQQYGALVSSGQLIDVAPDQPVDVALYWHAWKVQSPRLESLTQRIVAAAREVLGGEGEGG
ncbi:LysR family transcriptional regulator ArgP [Silvimonas iriomotensis]|uniref:LysR family transcriptional regulator n=1 Tax=Silvimonas iriomotensis TaxID=449662 RepID=A0ABQ2P7R8_9NEIS|nr:LysR family transcriptional regulator ArgP [Silvimonas iriomotensis]GGP20454.1 LysR family transcriptional regulator [Silvimonas iriomotensis]